MNIRLLEQEDCLIFKALRLEALLQNPEAFGSSFEEESAMTDAEFLDGFKKSDIFGAFVENQLGGCAGFFVYAPLKMRHRGVLFSMYIKPDFRKTAIGDVLVKTIISHAKNRKRSAKS